VLRWTRVAIVTVAVLAANVDVAFAHAGPRSANPEPGATLGDTPEVVRLSFSEDPDLSLSSVQVLDAAGNAYHDSKPQPVRGDARTVVVRVRKLERGVYTVSWRVVSAVDGHTSVGSYSFGVRMTPAASAFLASSAQESVSAFEMAARMMLMAGFIVLLGASGGHLFRFAPWRQDQVGAARIGLPAFGWVLAATAVVCLGFGQRSNSQAPLSQFLQTPTGRALVWRSAALLVAGAALVLVSRRPRRLQASVVGVAVGTLAAIAAHAAAGHAAADRGWRFAAMVVSQWAHIAAASVWIGGLAALLLAVRGAPSDEKALRVRRYASAAACGLGVVVGTGIVRSLGELSAWGDLLADPYGRTLTAKIALTGVIALCGAVNRWRHVRIADSSLHGLRILGGAEVALAGAALAAASALGALAPPRAGLSAVRELVACGSDAGTTVRVCLTAASEQPGPNRFTVRAVDYDTRREVAARSMTVRFTSLEDPGLPPTSLALQRSADGSFTGSGANLAFAGHWEVDVAVASADLVSTVRLAVETASPAQFTSQFRPPGSAPQYTVYLPRMGQVHFTTEPGTSEDKILVTFFDMIGDEVTMSDVVLTTSDSGKSADAEQGERRTRQLRLERAGPGKFVGYGKLDVSRSELVATGRSGGGTRLRARLKVGAP
jgi:copper transport protein